MEDLEERGIDSDELEGYAPAVCQMCEDPLTEESRVYSTDLCEKRNQELLVEDV